MQTVFLVYVLMWNLYSVTIEVLFFFRFLVACIAIWSLWFWSLNITKVQQEEQSFNFSTHY